MALSILSIPEDAPFAVIECGISHCGEMKSIEQMLRPDIGILTDITGEHDDGFSSRREKIDEKLKLFDNVRQLIVCTGNETDSNVFEALNEFPESKIIDCRDCDCNVPDGFDNFSKRMAKLAATASRLINPGANMSATMRFQRVPTRISLLNGVNGCQLLHDRFTNDIPSLELALDFARRRAGFGQTLTLVLADENKNISEMLPSVAQEYGVSRIITVASGSEFKRRFTTDDFADEIILIKGTPASCMDEAVSMLEEKQHETILEINLDNIVSNFNFFRSKLKPETGIVVMLKAAGYGCGSLELAKTLQCQGAAAVAVAVIDEGVELRKAGISIPIIVLNPRSDNYGLMFKYRLEPEIYSFEILDSISERAKAAGINHYPVHIKLDTGMHRLGFNREQLPRLVSELRSADTLRISSAFSHLATADCFDMDDYTLMQLRLFDEYVGYLRENINYRFNTHILNTAGILRYPGYQHEMVRLGIGLYGYPVLNDGSEKELKPVASLYSTVISVSKRHEGDTIGYGRKGHISGEREIATVPVGYADGIDRHLGNGNTSFIVNGHRCRTVGNICMDICMIDVTGAGCKVGDRVEIFGPTVSVCELADTLSTIPYEIIVSISERVKRVYYRD